MRKKPDHSLTEAQRTQLNALEGREPDTADIPEAPAENWKTARRGPFFRPRKEAISLRVDMDVLDWLRRHGPGYQTEINRILREKMEAETRS
ncbi:MAG TPA: BrnA antitoxin family protein [Acetobacteraceae bacterium]|jgi:uncharacterized protein (DUF4415 family)|nr:BrnA antitoxin family protein [Acetobacteraceae bacterium]